MRTAAAALAAALLAAAWIAGGAPAGAQSAVETYARATEAMDDRRWEEAARLYGEVADAGGPRADAALYWRARALAKLNRKSDALAAIERLASRYPDSDWRDDAESLAAELGGARSGTWNRGPSNDEATKLQALLYLMRDDPAKAGERLARFLEGDHSDEAKRQALFLLLQSDTPGTLEIAERLATGDASRAVREAAIEMISVLGSERAAASLETIYRGSGEPWAKKRVIQALMVAGRGERLAQLAREETDSALRAEAAQMLAVLGRTDALADIVRGESDPEVRARMTEGFLISGDVASLRALAASDPDERVRRSAIRMLGAMGAADALKELYAKEPSDRVRGALIESLMVSGRAEDVLEIARTDRSVALRGRAAEQLGAMGRGDLLWGLMEGEDDPDVQRRILAGMQVAGDADALRRVVVDRRFASVRREAIQMLGLVGGEGLGAYLADVYADGDRDAREAVLEALFMRQDVDALIRVARTEKDPDLRRKAVELLGMTGSKRAREFMLEVLDEN